MKLGFNKSPTSILRVNNILYNLTQSYDIIHSLNSKFLKLGKLLICPSGKQILDDVKLNLFGYCLKICGITLSDLSAVLHMIKQEK